MKPHLLFWLLSVLVAAACRPPAVDEPLPLTYPELRITSIHFAGIPDDNVQIDQPTRTIRVRMPATLTGTTTPTVTLSDEAKLVGDLTSAGIGTIQQWCRTDTTAYQTIYLTSKQSSAQLPTVQYTIRPIAMAPLTAADASVPVPPFVIGDSSSIRLPVQYLYGNMLPKTVTFVNQSTQVSLIVKNQSVGTIGCSSGSPNQINVLIDSKQIEPGLYNVTMQRADGSTFTEPNALTVSAGRASLDRDPIFGYTLVAGQPASLTISGTNLFSEQVQVRLTTPDGSTMPVTQTQRRSPFVLILPVDLKPGYYGLDLPQTNQPAGISYRLSVLRMANQPYIGMINYQPAGRSPAQTPLALPRNQAIAVAIGNRAGTTVFTLISQTTSQSYPLPITSSVNGGYPMFTVPANVPAGRYTAQVQQIDPATQQVIQRSEPFEQPIDVP